MKQTLAEIAVSSGLVTRADINRATRLAREKGRPLVVSLIREIGVDELTLLSCIHRATRILVTDPAAVSPDPDALRVLSRGECLRFRVLPLEITSYAGGRRFLQVAMADPTDAVAMAEIKDLAGCEVQPTIMPMSSIEELIEVCYRQFVTDVTGDAATRLAPPSPATAAALSRTAHEPTASSEYGDVEPHPSQTERAAPVTTPFHRISDEAPLAVRHEVLLNLLVEKGLITRDEYDAQIIARLKERSNRD